MTERLTPVKKPLNEIVDDIERCKELARFFGPQDLNIIEFLKGNDTELPPLGWDGSINVLTLRNDNSANDYADLANACGRFNDDKQENLLALLEKISAQNENPQPDLVTAVAFLAFPGGSIDAAQLRNEFISILYKDSGVDSHDQTIFEKHRLKDMSERTLEIMALLEKTRPDLDIGDDQPNLYTLYNLACDSGKIVPGQEIDLSQWEKKEEIMPENIELTLNLLSERGTPVLAEKLPTPSIVVKQVEGKPENNNSDIILF